MPLTSPAVISDCVSLSDKLTRLDFALVPEECAVDAGLSTVVDEFSPNKSGSCTFVAEAYFLTRTSEQLPFSTILVVMA